MRANVLWLLASTVLLLTFSTIRSNAGEAWGAFTVSCIDGIRSGYCEHAVSTGFGSGPTQDAAKAGSYQQAISHVNSSFPWKCTTARTFNRGCSYIAEGCNDNHCAWAISASAADALKKLDAMASARGGGCVER